MSISAFYIIDSHGRILITRNYRGDIPSDSANKFIEILREKDEKELTPILLEKELCYIYIKVNGLYLMGCTRRNSNVISILCYLNKLSVVFREYFGEIKEEAIKDNFVLLYELFDEMMDFGYPQLTDHKILQQYITQEGNISINQAAKSVSTVTNTVSWRPEGIFYKNNEVFLDIVERIDLQVAPDGTVSRCEIFGTVEMKSCLSGMPEVRLGLNDKLNLEIVPGSQSSKQKGVEIEDVRFHQCVRLSKFDLDRTISFIPPDGKFNLMTYKVNAKIPPLIWVDVSSLRKTNRIIYTIKVTSKFRTRSSANDVEIFVPVPTDVDTPLFKTGLGYAKYEPDKDSLVWKIKQLHGGKEGILIAQFGLPSVQKEEPDDLKGRDINVVFEIPYYTVSQLQVRYLKVIDRTGYQSSPWVRYITRNGKYNLRMK